MKWLLLACCVGVALFCSAGAAEEFCLVARKDFDVPQLWKSKNVQGKDFRTMLCSRFERQGTYWQGILQPGTNRPFSEETVSIQTLSKLPAFRNSGVTLEPYFQVFDFKLMEKYNQGQPLQVKNMLKEQETKSANATVGANVPLIIRDWASRPFPLKLSGGNYCYDSAECAAWLKAHPNFHTFDMGEWDNEYINIHYYINVYQQQKKIDDATAAKIRADFPVVTTKDGYVDRMKKAFDRKKSLYFGDPSRLSFMQAGWNIGHLAAYWGSGMITLETSNSGGGETYYRWQVGMSFARGAARQYSIPWMWYIASCLNGFTADGKWVSSWEPAFDSNRGVGASWLKRCFYLAYFSGADLMELEHWYLKILAPVKDNPKEYTLSRIGKDFTEFCDFTAANPDRGTPYTPIALLVPFNQGYPQWGGNGWAGAKPYTRPDFTLDAFWATIVPSYDRVPALKRGEQGALFNSPYGDIFDVVIPDAPEPRNLTNVLDTYKVAIIAGDIKSSPELTTILTEYVKKGGTLVLNSGNLKRFIPPELAGVHVTLQYVKLSEYPGYLSLKMIPRGAKVLQNSKENAPLLTIHPYGKGNIVVSGIESWVPSMTATSISHTRRGMLKFPFIQELLSILTKETLPLEVKGDIQYGVNRTNDGWIVYLINNKGVTKMADTPEKTDSAAAAKVTVNWNDLAIANAVELRCGKTSAINGKSVEITVQPGDVSVLKLTEEKKK